MERLNFDVRVCLWNLEEKNFNLRGIAHYIDLRKHFRHMHRFYDLEAHWQIFKKWYLKKYCSCDKACQFLALIGFTMTEFLENLTTDDKFINKRVRPLIHQTMCLKRVEKKKYQDAITRTFLWGSHLC